MNRKKFYKGLSFILAFLMLLGTLPTITYGNVETELPEGSIDVNINEELLNVDTDINTSINESKKATDEVVNQVNEISNDGAKNESVLIDSNSETDNLKILEKGEDYTIFKNEDGSKRLDMYAENVRYKDENGKYVDYDNSIEPIKSKTRSAQDYKYTNAEGEVDVKFPDNLSQNIPISVSKEEQEEVTFLPIFNHKVTKSETQADLEQEVVTDIYNQKEEKNTKIVYGTDDNNISLEYLPLDNGVKENIILYDKPSTNIFEYELNCEGMIPSIPSVGGVLFHDKVTGEERGAILVPYMNDSSEDGAYSEDLHYSLEEIDKNNDKYKLILTVSKEYLDDEKRVYPVIIDPTYTAKPSNGVKDVYIESGYPTSNFFVSTIRKMPIGYGSTDKICRTLIKFPELQAKIKGNHVTLASLKLYELSNGSPFATVEVRRNTQAWDLGKVTWNIRPNHNTSMLYASKKLSNSSKVHSLNVTKLVQEWARGTYANYGLLLKASTESSGTKNYCSFHGTRSATTSKRPALSVNYTSLPSAPTLATNVTATSSSTTARTIYVKEGASVTVKWTGITSPALESIQKRVVRYKADKVLANATEISAYAKVGTTSSGSNTFAIKKANNWTDGMYGIGIRGVDKGNKKGTGKYCFIYVDNTAPNKASNLKLSSYRSSATADTSTVKVTFTKGTDPGTNPSGIGKNTITLYKEDGSVIKSVTSTTSVASCTFNNVQSDQKVYATVVNIDKSGNKSAVAKSAIHEISNMVLPQIKEENGLTSNIQDNPWINNTKKDLYASWDVEYKDENGEINLNKITATVLKEENDDDVEVIGETALAFPEGVNGYPKKYNRYKINDLFDDFNNLPDGKYKVKLKFYAEDGVGYDEGVLLYNKDNVSPTLNILQPEEGAVLKGVVSISYEASDDNAEDIESLGEKRISIIDANGKEKVLTNRFDTCELNTTEYDAGEYTIRYYVSDMAGNEVSVDRKVSIENPPTTPIIDLINYYGSAIDAIKLKYQWINGDEGVNRVDHLEYSINPDEEEAEWVEIEGSNPNEDESTKYDEKTAELIIEGLVEGENNVYIRAVDSDGLCGTIRTIKYIADTKAPEISISSPNNNSQFIDFLFIKGSITDEHLKDYSIYIANGENPSENAYTLVKTIQNPKEKTSFNGTLAIVNLKDNNKYPTGSKFTLKIVSSDTCENVNDETKILVEKKEVINHDADFTIEKQEYDEESVVLADNAQTSFNLKTIDNKDYVALNDSYFVDGEKLNKNENNKFDFSNVDKYPDDSENSIIAIDSNGSERKYSVNNYEYNLYDDVTQNDEEFNNVQKINKTITLSDKTTDGSYIIKNSAISLLPENTLSLKVVSDDNDSNIEYYLKLNNEEYVKVNNNEENYLGGSGENFILDGLNLDSIELKAVLKGASDTNPTINSINVVIKGASGDVLKVDLMKKFNPNNVTVESGLNYRTKISWDKIDGADNEDVFYEIYRSEGDVFDAAKAKIVASGVKDNYWYDSYTPIDQYSNVNNNEGIMPRSAAILDYEKDFSYKVKAVKAYGDSIRKSNGTEGNQASMLPALDEYTKRLGTKDYLSYFDFETPVSNGSVEQSMGNLVYEQSDGSVSGMNYDIDMNRVYNSMSTSVTPFGIGWDFDFNHILLETYNEYGDSKGMVYKDGSGTIYNFLNINEEPKQIIDEASGKVKAKETRFKSPFGEYILLKKVEKLDVDDIDKDGNFDEAIDLNYVIKNRDGETFTFDRNAQIISNEDRNGNTVVYRYFDDDVKNAVGTNLDVRSKGKKGQLKEIEVLNGKTIEKFNSEYNELLSGSAEEQASFKNKRSIMTFEYNGDGLVERVNMKGGKYALYEYKNASFGLGKVRKVLSKVTTYTADGEALNYNYAYSSGSNLSTVKDGENNAYTIDYYSDVDNLDKVKEVTYPNGESKSYEYVKGSDNDTQDFVKTIEYTNAKSGLLGAKQAIGSKEVKYDADGRTIYTKDISGKETFTSYFGNKVTTTVKDVKSYSVDANGNIVTSLSDKTSVEIYDSVADDSEMGKVTDSKGNILREESSDGSVTKYYYDKEEFDEDREVTEIDGEITEDNRYTYDTKGNILNEVEMVTGDATSSIYDENGQVLKETDIKGGKSISSTSYTYDEYGNELSETLANADETEERTSMNEYDAYGRVIKETDAKGYSTMYEYDGYDRVIKTIKNTKPDNDLTGNAPIVTQSQYNKNGSLIYEKKEDGTEVTYTYDNMNRAIKTVTKKNNKSKTTTTSYGYANENERKFIMGEEEKTYDFLNKQTSVSDGIESVSYTDNSGQNVKSTSLGNSTYNEYDSEGQVVKTFSIEDGAETADGRMTITLYDEKGQETHTIESPHYANGAYSIDDESIVTTSAYDKKGNKISEMDPMGNETKYAYSDDNRTSEVILEKDNVTKTEEDVFEGDNTKSVTTNALGNMSEEVSDAFGNTVEVRDIGKGTENEKKIVTKYEYDKNDNKIKETYANGDYKTFTYDYDGKVIEEKQYRSNDRLEENATLSYDLAGNNTKIKEIKYDDSGNVLSTEYIINGYDEFNRLSSYYEGQKESPTDSEKIRYEYNSNGQVVKMIYPSAAKNIKSVLYEYDNKMRVSRIKAITSSSQAAKTVREYTYSPRGNVATIKDYTGFDTGSGKYILRTYTYDNLNRVTKMIYKNSNDLSRTAEEYNYTYDKNNNILTEEILNSYFANEPIHEVKTYTYDNLNRLVKVEETDKTYNDQTTVTSYAYDKVGNRVSETKGDITKIYSYNNLNELLNIKNGEDILTSYTYDSNGNEVKEVNGTNVINKQYDINNQMTSYEEEINEVVSLKENNEYNYNGQRNKKEVIIGNKRDVTNYFYDDGNVLYTTDNNNNILSSNILNLEGNIISTAREYDNPNYDYDTYFFTYNKDIRNSTTVIVNSDNNYAAAYKYGAFGETEEIIGLTHYADFPGDSGGVYTKPMGVDNEICYTGGIYDKEIGEYYLNARYYDPATARFTTLDTYRGETEDPATLHLYAYCANNPINYIDPSGHLPIEVGHFKGSMTYNSRHSWLKIKITHTRRGNNYRLVMTWGNVNVSCVYERTKYYTGVVGSGKKTVTMYRDVDRPKSGHEHYAVYRGGGFIYKNGKLWRYVKTGKLKTHYV